jgi:hypothetical protein
MLESGLAVMLRKHLRMAGIARAKLAERLETRMPIRFHDLRPRRLRTDRGVSACNLAKLTAPRSGVPRARVDTEGRRAHSADARVTSLRGRSPRSDPPPTS